jgi:hypothetical protein
MHGWDLAALLIGVFWLGGYVALLGKSIHEALGMKRDGRATYAASERIYDGELTSIGKPRRPPMNPSNRAA